MHKEPRNCSLFGWLEFMSQYYYSLKVVTVIILFSNFNLFYQPASLLWQCQRGIQVLSKEWIVLRPVPWWYKLSATTFTNWFTAQWSDPFSCVHLVTTSTSSVGCLFF
jgi:hypothetical protein